LKLDLADTVRDLIALARERRDEHLQQAGRDLLARLATDRFDVAVLGQFSRGKSTLMNAVMGHPYLPTGPRPTTSLVTSVRFGSRPRALVHREGGGLPFEIGIAAVAEYVAGLAGRSGDVAGIDVELPAEVLRLGFNFVDTPGVGSAIRANTAAAQRFLPQTDAAILVTGVDSPMTEAEVDLLQQALEHGLTVFLVVNKIDLVEGADAESALAFVRAQAAELASGAAVGIFPLSALEGLRAKQASDPGRLAHSGMAAFEAALIEYLTRHKAGDLLHRGCDRAERLVGRARMYANVAVMAGDPARDGGEARTRFGLRRDEIIAEARRRAAELHQTVKTDAALLAQRRRWAAELSDRLVRVLDALSETVSSPAHDSGVQDLSAALADAAEPTLRAWRDECLDNVRQRLASITATTLGPFQWVDRLVEAAAAAEFGVPSPPEWSGERSTLPPPLTSPQLVWSLDLVPPRRLALRRRGRSAWYQDALQRLSRAVDGYCPELQVHVDSDLDNWSATVSEELQSRATIVAERLIAADPAQARRHAVRLEDMQQRLLRLRSAVDDLKSAPERPPQDEPRSAPQPGVGLEGQRRVRSRCIVCSGISQSQFDYLAHAQYELATDPIRQAEHADKGGFCAFHTWVFSDLASPLGMAAAYARLAAAVGETLLRLGQSGRDREEILLGVAGLTVDSDRCPGCNALQTTERDLAQAVVRSLDASSPATLAPPLCLPHALLVVNGGIDVSRARTLVQQLGATMVDLSEDMRIYALKREALHGGRISHDEEGAAAECLALLAGSAVLARRFSGSTELSVD
jgi:small GTP-binding protein